MKPFKKIKGLVAPLDRSNVDTDQIIPKQFLKRVERTGFGKFAFFDWRYLEGDIPNPNFILNAPRYSGAEILVAGSNFGSGSSREHAPWALLEYGFKVLISTSFADIFKNNCFQNGILPIILDSSGVSYIMANALAEDKIGYKITVDLDDQTVSDGWGFTRPFEIDPFRKESLLKGFDDIERTILLDKDISIFEKNRINRW